MMNSYIALVIIAIVGGVTVALQGQFMGLIDKGIGKAFSSPMSAAVS